MPASSVCACVSTDTSIHPNSIQLGFTHYDSEDLPNGNKSIIRDAIVYYIPNAVWNIGFGQTKIKANRARINSSSALQFVDRSIVNSEFNIDRDFGLFGELNPLRWHEHIGQGLGHLGRGAQLGHLEKRRTRIYGTPRTLSSRTFQGKG